MDFLTKFSLLEKRSKTHNCMSVVEFSSQMEAENKDEYTHESNIPIRINNRPVKIGQNQIINEIIRKYQKADDGTQGKVTVRCHYIPSSNLRPIRLSSRPLPIHYREIVKSILEDLLEQKIIRESSSPYSSLAILVPKKNRDISMCIDYRKLNKNTKKDSYPLPLMNDVQNSIFGS